ncbi:MAG: pyrroline-5-carboxylate reductase dimerization domain-containing protein, partial [Myxococcota bacterium]
MKLDMVGRCQLRCIMCHFAHPEFQENPTTMGRELHVPDERHIDIATAVSGSGPGFIFLVLEAMIAAAVNVGLRRELAQEMVYQTALGSAAYASQSDLHPA